MKSGPMWYNLEKTAKTWVVRQVASFMPPQILDPSTIDWSRIKRILVIRQHDQFGDFLLNTPAIHALRELFPLALIELVVRPYLAPVAERNPDVDGVLVFRGTGMDRLPGREADGVPTNMHGAFSGHCDLAVVFNTVSHSFSSDLIARFSRAPLILGPERPGFDHCEKNPFYNLVAPVELRDKHQVERNLDVVRYIGGKPADLSYRYGWTEDEDNVAGELMHRLEGVGKGRIVAVHFGSVDERKVYPLRALARLCNEIVSEIGERILLLDVPGCASRMAELKAGISSDPMVAPPSGLRELAALLRYVDLLICNDTGVLHLASAVGTPTVSFHAMSDPAIWKPPGDRHLALYASQRDIGAIGVDDALAAVREQLGRYPNPPATR